MPNTPFTQQRSVQFRGPTTSEDYNERIEQNYDDLVLLYNRIRLDESLIDDGYGRFIKDQNGIMQTISDLESRVAALEASQNTLVFYHPNQIDNSLFANTSFAIPAVSQNNIDTQHGMITLPLVSGSSISKLAFVDNAGNTNIPSTLGTTVVGSGADSGTATIDSSPPELAMSRSVGSIWQRNVIVPNPVVGGAQLILYIAAPTDLFTTANSNCIMLHPFPAFSTDIQEVAYTTSPSVLMNDSDNYIDFPANYSNTAASVGWTPPGAWNGDTDVNAGFRAYYFDPLPITGLRIKLAQNNYYYDSGNYVYSYGASLIDLRYNKFLSSGQTIIRFDAPSGGSINNVTSVNPEIYNVAQSLIPEVFSWQAIYETAEGSGIYTTQPVAFSSRVWILVTLNQTPGGGTPAVNSLSITYS